MQDNIEEEFSKKIDTTDVSITDWNEAIEEGKKYSSGFEATHEPFPNAIGYTIIKNSSSTNWHLFQIAFNDTTTTPEVAIRRGTYYQGAYNWQNWDYIKRTTQVDYTIDWNELTEANIYFFSSHPTGANKASNDYGMLEVFINNTTFVMQRFTKFDGSEVYTRGKYGSSDWSSWKKWT